MAFYGKTGKLFYGKLGTKLLMIIISLLIFTLIGEYYQYANSEKLLTDETISYLETVAQARVQNIDTYLTGMKGRMIDFSSDGKIKDCLYYINHNLSGCTKEQMTNHLIINKMPAIGSLVEVSTLDPNGLVVASSNKKIIGQNKKNEGYFTKGLINASIILYTRQEDTGAYLLTVSEPVKRNGELVGVVVGNIKRDDLQSILSDHTGLGDTGETFIVGPDYLMRSDSRFINDSVMNLEVTTENSFTCFLYETKPHEKTKIFQDYRDITVLGTHDYMPAYDMCLIAKINEQEALGSTRRQIEYIALIFITISIIFGLIIIYLIQKSFVNPIGQLLTATKELSKGKFQKVKISSGNELEELGNAFNKTVNSLENIDKEKKQVDQMKTKFLSITSHELRSPVTPVRGYLQMLLEDYFGKLNQKQKAAITIALRNTDRLDSILLDLLEISRIEAARLKFNFIRTDITKCVTSTIKEMKNFDTKKNITLIPKISRLPIIEVDPERVSQVLRNLLSNAIKFSKTNGKVIITAELKNRMIQISVQDFGIGIAKENQKKLFEPFFQEEQTIYRKYGGSGLGLAICKGIVESQNGKIWLNSEKGKGSTFYFTIPLKPVKTSKPIKLLLTSREPLAQSPLKNMEQLAKIKLTQIDYEKIIGKLVEKAFKLYGDMAIKKANSIRGLEVGKNGKIKSITGNRKEILINLNEAYTEIIGDLGKSFQEDEFRSLLKKKP